MLRVSTASTYANMLANLTQAQVRQNQAGDQVSSKKNATDLKGYAKQAEVLTAMRGVQIKVAGFLDQTSQLTNKLALQDTALNRLGDSVSGSRTAIADALAADDGTTISQALSGFFNDAAGALNSTYDGRYLFAGGQTDTPPVSTTNMNALASPATVAAQFKNDSRIASNRLDENTTMNTGFLASDLGTKYFTTVKAIKDYTDANGAFSQPLTDDQKAFLTTQLGDLDQATTDITNATASNGLMQNRLESTQTDLKGRADALDGMVGDITDVDMPRAVSNLQQAQLSVQAAAQVFQTLNGSSLLALLQS